MWSVCQNHRLGAAAAGLSPGALPHISDSDDDDVDDEHASLLDESQAEAEAPAEVVALCWCAGSVGVARLLCTECRIEVFEVPVCVVAGETVRRNHRGGGNAHAHGAPPASHRRRSAHAHATGGDGEVRVVAHEDVPPGLLWLVRYLQVCRPQVLLPHCGSAALADIVALVSEQTPIEVIQLSAVTAFCATEALRRLAAMYPAQETELAARFHAERTAMMRAMAALLQFAAAVQSNVADVVERDVLHALYIEDACAEALQITRTERHPSSGQGRGCAKEGLSLRGVLGATQGALGRAMLRQWVALPCCDAAEIEGRQSVVAFFAAPSRHDLAARLRVALHRVRSTTHIFTLMRSGRVLHKHYASLHQTMRGMLTAQELLGTVAHEVGRLYVLLQSIDVAPLRDMAASLAAAVVGVARRRPGGGVGEDGGVSAAGAGWPERPPEYAMLSSESGPTQAVRIRDGVDAVLDELRVRLHELRLSLHAKAEAAFAELPWTLRARLSLRCVYAVPHGYLLCTPARELTAALVADGAVTAEERVPGPVGTALEGEDEESEEAAEDETQGPLPRQRVSDAAPATQPASPSSLAERVGAVMAEAFGWRLHHEAQDGDYCFKSAAMEELDAWVGDLQRRAQQREEQVRRELDTALLLGSLHLLRPTRALGELDCLLGFARVTAQEGWSRPELVVAPPPHSEGEGEVRGDGEEGVLEIEDGWHPLLSRCVGLQQLVPFSLHLRTSTDRVCLVLGTNSSGKSVLMGAVAQIVFLAHLGCHVPAVRARMSLVSSIFAPSSYAVAEPTRVGSANVSPWMTSCGGGGGGAEAAQSSFYGECVALHRVLHFVAGQQRALSASGGAAGRALILLDEFGRGTAPEDACALLQATLQYFAAGGGSAGRAPDSRAAPLLFCATHLVEMLEAPRPGNVEAAEDEAARGEEGSAVHDTAAASGVPPGDPAGRRRWPPYEPHGPVAPFGHTHAPLPLEWVKVYEMEAYITYGEDAGRGDGAAGGQCQDSAEALRLPQDVTPTYQPVCVTPHAGPQRRQDWEQRSSAQLDAGPAVGRQCGLDPALLRHWEAALAVLRRS